MHNKIHEISDSDLDLINGGVTMSPDGKSCTDPRGKNPQPGLFQGGPEQMSGGLLSGR